MSDDPPLVNEPHGELRMLLRRYKYTPDRQEEATATVLKQAESMSAEWAEA